MSRFFKIKKIKKTILGDILKRAREEKKITLDQVEKATLIKKKYLEALENGNKEKLPDNIYVKNFLKAYADFLNLETEPLIKIYEEEFENWQKEQNLTKKTFSNFLIVPQVIKILVIATVIISLLLYLGLEIKKNFSPPFLYINSPTDNLETSETVIEVEGQTEKEVKVTINDQEIPCDENGYFKETVNLNEGLNIIKISAKKKYSRENIIYRKLMVLPK
jgi:cytoskeletal protein RodZ